jgi:SWI/SNF-related matrix-associated actin-dependent regulator of chromatin subfamily A member 5
MVKEDRSGWVAVKAEFSSQKKEEIAPAKTAYQYFQKNVADEVKAELAGQKFDVGQFSRRMRDRWAQLPDSEKEYYEGLASNDMIRFNQESHLADVARMEHLRKLQEERDQVIIFDTADGKKSTRRGLKKLQRKQEKIDRKRAEKRNEPDWNSDMEDEDEGSFSEGDDDSDDSDSPKKKKAAAPRQISAAMVAKREQAKQEKAEKEAYVAERQDNLRKDRAHQAKRRLDFLLKQSDIFSHFGTVKEESSRYSKKTSGAKDGARRTDDEAADEADFEDKEQETTYLLAQPTTLGFGKMRAYQLEGLNWMLRLQENGVNGIL